ncbi:MAG: hypothetical protein ACXAC7_21360 [Candidatus Hodarchaeales archaeon]|jgi:hypothetical protein
MEDFDDYVNKKEKYKSLISDIGFALIITLAVQFVFVIGGVIKALIDGTPIPVQQLGKTVTEFDNVIISGIIIVILLISTKIIIDRLQKKLKK